MRGSGTIALALGLLAGCQPREIPRAPPSQAPAAPHERCGEATCGDRQRCLTYFPIRDRPGPAVRGCESVCSPAGDDCGAGQYCAMESAGPGFVCRERPDPPPLPGDIERLVRLAEAWSFVRFAHPALADRRIAWTEALVAAIPLALADDGLPAALATMLDTLDDPATAVVGDEPHEPPESGDALRRENDALVVVVRLLGEDAIRKVIAELPTAERIVFDLRDVPSHDQTVIDQLFEGFNPMLVDEAVELPTSRWRVLHGFPPEAGRSSGGYYEAFESSAAELVTTRRDGAAPRVAFVTGRSQVLPPIALPLRERGQAIIVAPAELDERAMAATELRPVPGGGSYRVRSSEVVYRGGSPRIVADVVTDTEPVKAALKRLGRPIRKREVKVSPLRSAVRSTPPHAEPDTLPDAPHRLATAIDLWSTLDVFHAYPTLRTRWERALPAALVEVRDAEDWASYLHALMRLGARTDDGHTHLQGKRVQEVLGGALPPFRPAFVQGCLVVEKILQADRSGELAIGDVIRAIDGVPVSQRFAQHAPLVAASTPDAHRGAVAWHMLRGPDGALALDIEREGKSLQIEVSRWPDPSFPESDETPYRVDASTGIGFVDLRRLEPAQVPAMFEALADTKAIVFDMRGYPRGTAWTIAPYLAAADGPTPAAAFLQPLVSAGYGDPHRGRSFVVPLPEADVQRYRGRTAMLIDSRAISQAEYTGMFFIAANDTLLVGSPTAGANGDVTSHVLPEGIVVRFTGQAVAFPDGQALQRVGLRPDIEVRPTIVGVRAGRDELTEAALAALGED